MEYNLRGQRAGSETSLPEPERNDRICSWQISGLAEVSNILCCPKLLLKMTHRPSCYNYYNPSCSCLVLQPSRATHSVFTGFEYKAPHEAEMPEAEELL